MPKELVRDVFGRQLCATGQVDLVRWQSGLLLAVVEPLKLEGLDQGCLRGAEVNAQVVEFVVHILGVELLEFAVD